MVNAHFNPHPLLLATCSPITARIAPVGQPSLDAALIAAQCFQRRVASRVETMISELLACDPTSQLFLPPFLAFVPCTTMLCCAAHISRAPLQARD
ncbi:hypothetical protein T440DRAFT_468112, partial [Plenodomus tracheiphilus IPT5]